jgi:MoxR-like ATPase
MIRCELCGFEAHYLAPHLMEQHNVPEDEYCGTVTSPALDAAMEAGLKGKRRVAFDPAKGVFARFAGIELPVSLDIPADACLPLPPGYAVPRHGKLADAVRRVAVRVAAGNSKPIWVWGPPGTGKDAVFHALSAMLRRPAVVFNIAPDVDVSGWLATRALGPQGTYWEEGPLLKSLRDGYVGPDGKRTPYIVVLSDIDRATRGQMEPLRAILDGLGGRVQAADGMHKVLPGTLVVATANTAGGGDTSGKYTATPVDTSVLDRFTFKVVFENMDPRDEEPILRAKYPALAARFSELIPTVMRAVTAIRDAVEKDEIYMDFGHRSVCNWMDAVSAEAQFYAGKDAARVMRAGLQDILAGCANDDTREAVKRLVDPHLRGGAVEEGDTSHIERASMAF